MQNDQNDSAALYALGIDVGVGSIGWAVIDLDANDDPCGIRVAGVRGFDTGIPNMRDYRRGTEKLSTEKRRTSRSQRRQVFRRSSRRSTVFRILQGARLLPEGKSDSRQDRHVALTNLDKKLGKEFPGKGGIEDDHTLPYRLRAAALDGPLPLDALGRAIYHLCQRRGFKSNRKAATSDQTEDNDKGTVEPAISKLHEEMGRIGANTYAQYFVSESFLNSGERIRHRWTSRAKYKEEFEEIWKSQQRYHPCLTGELKKRLERAIFHQRPVRIRKSSIGKCSIERGRRRAPIACLDFQRFRYRQMLNNLQVLHAVREDPTLTLAEYDTLAQRLEVDGDLEFSKVRALLGLDKKPKGSKTGYKFNLELDEEDCLIGNRTGARLREVLGEAWTAMSDAEQNRLVEEVLAFENEEALGRRLAKVFPSLAEDKARGAARVRLERGYCSFSRKALRALLPKMVERKSLAEAKKEVYPERDEARAVCEELPPIRRWQPDIRNAVVVRALSELRTVVNHVIRSFGKPKLIRVELARDLKHSRKRREKITRLNLADRKARRTIVSRILKDLPNWKGDSQSRTDIVKVQLADECGWRCPYTGEQICMSTLLGPNPQFQMEHIYPRRYGDDSFANKTLCHHTANARKADRTPFRAFGGDAQRWREILYRVRRFSGKFKKTKLQRFLAPEVPKDFVDQQLNDTAHASRLAREYLGLLFGTTRYVQVSPGRATFHLRRAWKLDGVLHEKTLRDAIPTDKEGKNRSDHRHHAVDAIVVGVTNAKMVATLGDAAQRAEARGTRLSVEMPAPWPGYLRAIRAAINPICVSWRQSRRIRGTLHKETLYRQPPPGSKSTGNVRIPLKNIKNEKQIESIVDGRIKDLVRAKFKQHAADADKSPFENDNNHPYFKTKDGRIVFVHSVRVKPEKGVSVTRIGKGVRRRWVDPGADNHHVEVVALVNQDGKGKSWKYELCDRLEAARRVSAKEPVLRTKFGLAREFLFSVAKNEYVEMEYDARMKRLYRVVGVSGKEIEFHLHTDARVTKMKDSKRKRVRCKAGGLFKAKARKVVVDPLGNVLPAND